MSPRSTFAASQYRIYQTSHGIDYRVVRFKDESDFDGDAPLVAITTHADSQGYLSMIYCYPSGSVDTEGWKTDDPIISELEDSLEADSDPVLFSEIQELVEDEWVW